MKIKHLFPILLIAAPIVFSQCKKEDPVNPEDQKPDSKVETVTLRIENLGTKTTLSGDKTVYWTEGDVVTINGKAYPIEIDAQDNSKATVKDVEKSDAYVGTYIDGGVKAEGQVSVAFKSSLTYASGTFSTNENPMIAYSETETLQFNNAGGILKAGFTSADGVKVKAISIKSNSEDVLAGTYVFNVADLAEGNFENGSFAQTASATSVAISISDPVQLGSETSYFYFILPAGAYAEGLTIDVTDAAGNLTSCPSTTGVTIKRAEIAEMETPIEIKAAEVPDPDPMASEWGIVGDVNNWGNEDESGNIMKDITMYNTDTEGLFVAYNVTMPEGGFKIRANNEWNDAKNYGLAIAGTVEADHYYALICGSASLNMTLAAGTYDIWFDLNGSKVYVMTPGNDIANAENGLEEEITETYYDILGTFVGNYWNEPVVMTLEDNLYVAKGLVFDWARNIRPEDLTTKPYSQFKIRRNGSWMYEIGSPIIEGDWVVSPINSENQLISIESGSLTADVSFVETGTFDIYFDAATLKVWIMTPGYKPGDEIPVPDDTVSAGATIEEFTKTTIVW